MAIKKFKIEYKVKKKEKKKKPGTIHTLKTIKTPMNSD